MNLIKLAGLVFSLAILTGCTNNYITQSTQSHAVVNNNATQVSTTLVAHPQIVSNQPSMRYYESGSYTSGRQKGEYYYRSYNRQ